MTLSSNRMMMITKIRPMPPLGPYPQFLLWGQLGIAPSSRRIKIIMRIKPKLIVNHLRQRLFRMGANYLTNFRGWQKVATLGPTVNNFFITNVWTKPGEDCRETWASLVTAMTGQSATSVGP